jgi:peptidyl-tRNA hydrolase
MNLALYLPPSLTNEEKRERMYAALALLEEIKPQDGLEGMLAVQMVATHNAALECFKRAAYGEQTPQAFEVSLRHGEKLIAAFLRQMEMLDKRRGKGPQTVMVQSLNVEAGGQAVVGTVNTGPRTQPEAVAATRANTVAPQASKSGAADEVPARLGWDEA